MYGKGEYPPMLFGGKSEGVNCRRGNGKEKGRNEKDKGKVKFKVMSSEN
jgi:hypothetical protein